jgi:hypothetical protein
MRMKRLPTEPHQQTNPNGTQRDNYGATGNVNPYTSAPSARVTRNTERYTKGTDLSPRTEAVMSDQNDWEFSGADDAKMTIRAAVRYLIKGPR